MLLDTFAKDLKTAFSDGLQIILMIAFYVYLAKDSLTVRQGLPESAKLLF